MQPQRKFRRRGFSLAEAMIGMTIMALAGTVLLLGVETSLRTAIESEDEAVAAGMAEQLLDEILGHHYTSPLIGDPYQTPLGPSGAEAAGDGALTSLLAGSHCHIIYECPVLP